MGRKKTPTAMKLARGTAKKNRLLPDEPSPLSERPECPQFVTGVAAEAFDNFCITLDKMSMLSKSDEAAIALLALSYANFVECSEELAKTGMLVKGQMGNDVKNPVLPAYDRFFNDCRRMLCEFGLTPSSRTKIGTSHVKGADPFEQFLQARAG